jgi:ferredoxin--NADP+ reductase
MYLIKEKFALAPNVTKMVIHAPLITTHAHVGQFVMLRVEKEGERIPLTLADFNKNDGTITIIFQVVGKTTYLLNQLKQGDYLIDCAGPLGKKSNLEGLKRVILVGGGLGCAILYPIAKKLSEQHTEITSIVGFKNKSFVFLEEDFKQLSNQFHLLTDDGFYGSKGFVTDALRNILINDSEFDEVIAIGPIPMMKAVSELTRPYHIKTTVSMNPVMVDGTGMCGGCRIKVGNEMKFACVDGPEFDGHLVNFDEVQKRNQMYKDIEDKAYDDLCRGIK